MKTLERHKEKYENRWPLFRERVAPNPCLSTPEPRPLTPQPLPPTMTPNCDIGLIGLAVMGENLALNIESRGFRIAVFNRTTAKVDEFLAGRAKGKNFVGCHSLEELVGQLGPAPQGDAHGQGRRRPWMSSSKNSSPCWSPAT